jgi:hypothetical protein
MGRRGTRKPRVPTAHFEHVTPQWNGPRNEIFPSRYHEAAEELADWFEATWADTHAVNFFQIRNQMAEVSAAWARYDFELDRRWIAARQEEERLRPTLQKSTETFRMSLNSTAFRRGERELGIAIVHALCPDAEIELTAQEGVDAVAQALQKFEQWIATPDNVEARYGPAIYTEWPPAKRLPKPETMVAIALADLFTDIRGDAHQQVRQPGRRAPILSADTPWVAISEFVMADFDPEGRMESSLSLQSSVQSHIGKVSKILHKPD